MSIRQFMDRTRQVAILLNDVGVLDYMKRARL